MDSFELLEAAWNKQIDIMRNVPHIREWYDGFGTHNSFAIDHFDIDHTSDRRTILCEVIGGKQLKVTIANKMPIESTQWQEHSASFTRNIPHDLQRLFKGKK